MPWKILQKKFILKHPYLSVEQWNVRLPNGRTKDFLLGGGPYDFVMVVAFTTDRRVIILDQYYISQQKKIPTVVAGIVDKKEPPLLTARRELLEETGYAAKRWIKLGTTIKGKYTFGKVYYFLALGAQKAQEPTWEPAEDITIKEISLTQFKQMVRQQKFSDVFAEVCARRVLAYLKDV